MVDIGGGSIDVVILPEGLKAANSRESFQSIEGIPYLAHIDKLRKEKFLELFTDLRAFDQFILDNYSKQKFVLKNENTGESIDLTSTIKSSLREYVEILLAKLNDVAPPPANKVRKYVYCGGILQASVYPLNQSLFLPLLMYRLKEYSLFDRIHHVLGY